MSHAHEAPHIAQPINSSPLAEAGCCPLLEVAGQPLSVVRTCVQPAMTFCVCRQKIQYHQRQKQELEGLRKECTLLLRERFTLDQAIR